MRSPNGWPLLAAACGVAVVVLLLAFPTGAFQAWDQPVDAALRGADAAAVVLAAKALDFMGSIEFVAVAFLALAGALAYERRWRDAAVAAVALFASEAITNALKVAFARARPLDGLLETGSASFPSGHAVRGAILALLLAWYVAPKLASRPRARALALGAIAAWGVAMGAGRLVLHVHWLSDVLAGAALGLAVGALGVSLAAPTPARATRVEVATPVEVAPRASPEDAPEPSFRG